MKKNKIWRTGRSSASHMVDAEDASPDLSGWISQDIAEHPTIGFHQKFRFDNDL
jgi:hypothetical protein